MYYLTGSGSSLTIVITYTSPAWEDEMSVRRTTSTARPVPRSLAPVLAELELLTPETVDRAMVQFALQSAGDPQAGTTARVEAVIDGLRRAGWLLPMRTRGVWEFAPASRSGAFRSGDPFTELRAFLHRKPGVPVAVAMESAAFRRGLAQHPPSREVVTVGEGARREGALGAYRLVLLDLGPRAVTVHEDVPMHTVEGLLVAMARKPGSYHDWPNVRLWLAQAADQVSTDQVGTGQSDPGADGPAVGIGGLIALLQDAPAAAWARTAYLLRTGEHPDTAAAVLEAALRRPTGPVYLGPRHGMSSYDSVTGVYDALLRTA